MFKIIKEKLADNLRLISKKNEDNKEELSEGIVDDLKSKSNHISSLKPEEVIKRTISENTELVNKVFNYKVNVLATKEAEKGNYTVRFNFGHIWEEWQQAGVPEFDEVLYKVAAAIKGIPNEKYDEFADSDEAFDYMNDIAAEYANIIQTMIVGMLKSWAEKEGFSYSEVEDDITLSWK